MIILHSSRNGFSLVELLIALVIMIVGVLGLLQAVNLALQTNSQNQLRNEAVQVGDLAMSKLRVKPFDVISAVYTNELVASRQKSFGMKYTVSRNSPKFGTYSASRELVVQVRWSYKNNPQVIELRSVKSK